MWYSSLTELVNFKNYKKRSTQNVDLDTHVITAYFKPGEINAIILVISFDNLIDGMIIAVVIATKKQFQINYQNCNDHICILIFEFPQFKSSSSLVSPYGPCTILISCSRSLLISVVQSKCILPYVFYTGRTHR